MEFDLDEFNVDVVQDAAALLKARFETIVEYYLEDAQGYIDQIKKGFEEGDLDLIVQNAHPLKSSSEAVGVMAIHRIAKVIELDARVALENGGNIEQHKELVPLLEEALKRATPKLMACVDVGPVSAAS